jgi:hypothetical protein
MYFCALCTVCFVTFSVLFVCICVLNNCHRVATQLQLNIYHIIYHTLRVLFYYVCIALLCTLVAGLLARTQYPEGPATCHFGTDFFFVPLCLKANAEMVPKTPKLLLHASHVALPT